jgi:hypothetical protein
MSFKLSVTDRGGYLFFTITGENSRETVAAYMGEVIAACEKYDCFRILIHEDLSGPRLEAMDVFNLTSEGAMRVLGRFEAVAYVDEEMGAMADFAESVAVNRGMPIRFFSNLVDAERWIESRIEGEAEQYVFWDGGDRKS